MPATEDQGAPGPIPPGTRDVLPSELKELRRIEDAFLGEFEQSGYLEVRTPTIEYASLLEMGGRRGGPLYRFLDDRGELVALRNDMTVPVSRLAAARLGETEPPWRLGYLGSSFRTTSPRRADLREFGQAGVELIGSEGPGGTAEVLAVLDRCLTGVGVSGVVIAVGDATLWPGLLGEAGADAGQVGASLDALAAGDLVGLEGILRQADGISAPDDLVALARTRGGTEVLEALAGRPERSAGEAAERLDGLEAALGGSGIAASLVFDLGMARDPGYYTGEVFEVYAGGLGRSLGGGGRYDGLMGQLGAAMPAAGFSVVIERIHEALINAGASG